MTTPVRCQASSGAVGEQLNLIDPPPFSPLWPSPASLEGKALALLLKGPVTHPAFENATRSWRLAAYIALLRHNYLWPIETTEIPAPTAESAGRHIAKYVIPQWVMRELGALHG